MAMSTNSQARSHLDCEFVGGDGVEDLRDLAPDAVQVGAVQFRPLLVVLEETVDRAVRRRQRDLEAHPVRDHPLVPKPAEDPVRVDGEAAVGEVVEADPATRLDPPAPDAREILDRWPRRIPVGLFEFARGGERLLEVWVLREDHERQHPHPVRPLCDLAVREPPHVPAKALRCGSERLLRGFEGQAADEENIASCGFGRRAHLLPPIADINAKKDGTAGSR
jgi:hypothetical protein